MTDLMRMSVTSLDSWRYFLGSESMTEEDFIEDLIGHREPTLAMRRGTAFHLMMEALHAHYHESPEAAKQQVPEVQVLEYNTSVLMPGETFTFRFDAGVVVRLPLGSRERKVELAIDDIGVNLVGKADVVGELSVYDYKTQDKALDVERYYDAMQWRAYLMLFGRDRFVYEWYRLKPTKRGARHDYTIIESESFDQYRYAEMERDVLNIAAELADFRRSRGLEVLPRLRDGEASKQML